MQSQTVFKDFFRRPDNLIELYRVLHPEDTQITEKIPDDIIVENTLGAQVYNDISFTMGARLIILIDAKDSRSDNIVMRAFVYIAKSFKLYLEKRCLSVYSKRMLGLPTPEVYAIYAGDSQGKPGELTFSNEFFGGSETDISLTVKMLYGENADDVIGQYVRFSKVFDTQTKTHGPTELAVRETIRICKDENVLKKYFDEHEKEAADIMLALFEDGAIQNREKND